MGVIANLMVKLNADTSNFESAMSKTTATSQKMATAVGVAGAAIGVLGYKSVIAAGNMEQTTVAFTTMMGSAEKATNLLKNLQGFAATTPFQFTGVVDAARQLIAIGVSADELIPTMTKLGDVAAGLSIPMNQIVDIYGKIKTNNQAYSIELRQFAIMGIPIYEELGKVLDVDAASVKKLAESGVIGFKEIQQVFENMTKEGSKFGGLMEAQSATLLGKWSNLIDSIEISMITLGDEITETFNLKGVLDNVLEAVGRLATLLQQGGLQYALNNIFSGNVKLAIFAISGAISFSLIPALIKMAAAAWTAIAPLLPLMTIGAAIGVVGYTIYAISQAQNEMATNTEASTKATTDQADKIQTLKTRLNELQKSLTEVGKGVKASVFLASFDKINKLGSSASDSLIDSSGTIAEIGKIQEELAQLESPDVTPIITPQSITNELLFGDNWQSGINTIAKGGGIEWWNGFMSMINPSGLATIIFGEDFGKVVDAKWKEITDNPFIVLNPVTITLNLLGIKLPTFMEVIEKVQNAWKTISEANINVYQGLRLLAWVTEFKLNETWTSVKNKLAEWWGASTDNTINVYQGLRFLLAVSMFKLNETWTSVKNKIAEWWTSIDMPAFDFSIKATAKIVWDLFQMGDIVGTIRTMINGIIGEINKMIDSINNVIKVNIPHIGAIPTPPSGGSSSGNWQNERMAVGGITMGPRNVTVGEAGTEAILPLENNTEWMDILASKLAGIMGGNQYATAGNTSVYIDSNEIASRVIKNNDNLSYRTNGRYR